MLKLVDIRKVYKTGDLEVEALKGVSMEFGQTGFVAILGQSGCGKTTLLNVIGGLDHYTSGDLIIDGISTKEYKDKDWDAYRNRSIGFVFQSYHLIPHQTVLSNVELTMTLSGINKAERRRRAVDALTRVGLGDQLRKKPNQMSGGQMQRTAIARAIVNNPDIILADEPTGALDSETSVQIMDILSEISKEHLVIMVTHNAELAEKYATRIIRVADGRVVEDTSNFRKVSIVDVLNESPEEETEVRKKPARKKSMSFFTALSLSLNNLMTKKGRTFLTAFAGAIGIIGIALILAASTGVQTYIDHVEADTLSSYPLQINRETLNLSEMMKSMAENRGNSDNIDEDGKIVKIQSSNMMSNMITSLANDRTENDMRAFKKFLESDEEIKQYISSVEYEYATTLHVYNQKAAGENELLKVNPATVMDKLGMSGAGQGSSMAASVSAGSDVFVQIPESKALTDTMYELIDGRMPENYDEVVLAVTERGRIGDYTLYALGLLDQKDLSDMMKEAMSGKEVEKKEIRTFSFDELEGLQFTVLPNTAYFKKLSNNTYEDKSEDEDFVKQMLTEQGITLKVSGIVKIKQSGTSELALYGGVLYPKSLMQEVLRRIDDAEIVKAQRQDKDVDVFTGIKFEPDGEEKKYTMDDVKAYVETLPEDQQATTMAMIAAMKQQGMSDEEIIARFESFMKKTTDATYDGNLFRLGVSEEENPSRVKIYPKDFETKEKVVECLDAYSASLGENKELRYTDYVGLIMSSVTTIINVITYVLIGFVAVSLVVSSIMIGIITYISVLERRREIGILRAIGASKHDISRVFNAETLIIGFVSGLIGIAIPYGISAIVNVIVKNAFDIDNIMVLAPYAAAVLVIISMLLTLIGGFIPSKIAANKDPVEVLRTE